MKVNDMLDSNLSIINEDFIEWVLWDCEHVLHLDYVFEYPSNARVIESQTIMMNLS